MSDILEKIVATKKLEVANCLQKVSLANQREQAEANNRDALLRPAAAFMEHPAQRPPAERVHQPALLGHRDEVPRPQQATAGMVPAQQGLGADDAP